MESVAELSGGDHQQLLDHESLPGGPQTIKNIKAQINAINNNVQLQKTASQQTRIQALCSLRWRPCMVSARLRSAASSTDALPQG